MQEQSVMEFLKWFIMILALCMILAVAYYLQQISQVNTFKQQVNYQIERNGGLTETALVAIDEYAESYMNGTFEIESDKLNQKVNFGETVDYTIKAAFEIKIFSIPDVRMNFSGTGVSQVR